MWYLDFFFKYTHSAFPGEFSHVMSLLHVSYLKQTQQTSAKVGEKWLDGEPHQFMTETCSSYRSFSPGMDEMLFQPPSCVSTRRHSEPSNYPVNTGTSPPHLYCCLRFFSDTYPPCFPSSCQYFLHFPAWPLPPCCALLLGTCLPHPCYSQQAERWMGKFYKHRGVIVDQLLQELAGAIRSPKLPLLI